MARLEVMVVAGKRYLVNTALAPHVLDKVCDDILKYYPIDAPVHFEPVKQADILR